MKVRRHRGMILALAAGLLLAGAGGGGAWGQMRATGMDRTREKSSDALLGVFKESSAAANRSTVKITGQDRGIIRSVVWGTVVSEDGYVLTKASEVAGLSRTWVVLPMRGGGGGGMAEETRNYEAKIVGVSGAQDLAMLKIEARGLTPVKFASTYAPPEPPTTGRGPMPSDVPTLRTVTVPTGMVGVEVGEWVATARPCTDQQDIPQAVGVISVGRRAIALRSGFFGISFIDATSVAGVQIQQVVADSAAEKSGIQVSDIITAVNGKATRNRTELQTALRGVQPGDSVSFTVSREGRSLTINGALAAVDPNTETVTGGGVSRRSSDFAAVYQHDTVLDPTECGGPLVDLDGNVVGINIARAGRTETYAMPADVIVPLLEPLKNGKLAPK